MVLSSFCNFHFRAKFDLCCIRYGANRLHVLHSRRILNRNFFKFTLSLHKTCIYLGYSKMFNFCIYQLDSKLCFFFTSNLQSTWRCYKWLAVLQSLNGHKVRNVCKVWACKLFLRWIWVQTQNINKNCTTNDPKKGGFQDAFAILCMFFSLIFLLVFFYFKLMHGWEAVGFRICWHQKSWLLSISPEKWLLSLPEKTWCPWFHTVSYVKISGKLSELHFFVLLLPYSCVYVPYLFLRNSLFIKIYFW